LDVRNIFAGSHTQHLWRYALTALVGCVVLGWTVVEKEVAEEAALQGKSVRQYMENAHSHLSAQQPHSTYSFYTIDKNHTQVRKKVVLDT
jgi:hypothetical protein